MNSSEKWKIQFGYFYVPLLITGHCLQTTTILALIFLPACWIAKFPSLYTLIIDTVACKLPPLVFVVITDPVITKKKVRKNRCRTEM